MARILIIDDAPNVRATMRLMLEEAGHTVAEAVDGDSGLAAMKREAADLVICDVFMPGRNGVLTMNSLRKQFPRVKVIAVSGGCGDLTRPEDFLNLTKRLGADYAMAKPFSMDDLLRSVNALLHGAPVSPAMGS